MAAKVMECDLVVLGAGGTSLVAAVKAADDTGKKVIVLEKTKKPGGATTFMHVFPIKDSQWQKEAGETISNPPSMSGLFFDWLASKGGAEEYFKMAKPGDRGASIFGTVSMYKIMEKYKDRDDPSIGPGWTGTYIVEKMLECCKKDGNSCYYQRPGKEVHYRCDWQGYWRSSRYRGWGTAGELQGVLYGHGRIWLRL